METFTGLPDPGGADIPLVTVDENIHIDASMIVRADSEPDLLRASSGKGTDTRVPLGPSSSEPTFITNVDAEPVRVMPIDEKESEEGMRAQKLVFEKARRKQAFDFQAEHLRAQAAAQRRRVASEEKLKKDLIDKINLKQFDGGAAYYRGLPVQPGTQFFKWLLPKDIRHSLHSKRLPGINCIQLNVPETVVYSERYGVPELWVGTAVDGCVVKRNIKQKDWKRVYLKKVAIHATRGINTTGLPRKRRKDGLPTPDVVAMLKIANGPSPQSSSTRAVAPHSLLHTLDKPTPTAMLCAVQGYVRCKGPRAVVYRLMWRAKRTPRAFCIINETDFVHMPSVKPKPGEDPITDDVLQKRLTRHHCATSDVNGRGKLPNLRVFEIAGKALDPMVLETEKIVRYVQGQDTPYGHMKFTEFVADFIRAKNGDWVFLQCKAFKLDPDCMSLIRAQMHAEEEGDDGLRGDFATMAHSLSPVKRGRHGVREPRPPKSKFEERLKDNGKTCFFCEQRYLEGDMLPLAKVGGSPKKRARGERGLDMDHNVARASHESAAEGQTPHTAVFQRKVEAFGYDLTERMMQDTIRTLHRRGANPLCFALHLRKAARAEPLPPGKVPNVAASSALHKVCRFCFEAHNSQRVLVALSRQFALAMGVPRKGPPLNTNDARFRRLCGPGRKLKQRDDAGGVVSPPAYPAYPTLAGFPCPPPNSINPRFLDWIDVEEAPGHSMRFRMFFFFHELEELHTANLPKDIHAEFQYTLVESVQRIPVSLTRRGEDGRPNDVVPIKQLRLAYLYAAPKDLQSFLYNDKISITLLLSVGTGKDMMVAEGHGTIFLTSFLSSGVGRFGNRGYSHKADMRVPVHTEAFGELVLRLSVGIIGDGRALEERLLDTGAVRLGKEITAHGDAMFWMPENYHDACAMPESWMGAIKHGVSTLREAMHHEERELSHEEQVAIAEQNIQQHLIQLFLEFLATKENSSRFSEQMKRHEATVRRIEDLHKLHTYKSGSRPLTKAISMLSTNIAREKNLKDKQIEASKARALKESANVALAHAHSEMVFREEMKKMFDFLHGVAIAESARHKTSLFNRKSKDPPMVQLQQLLDIVDSVCRHKRYFRVRRAVQDGDDEEEELSGGIKEADEAISDDDAGSLRAEPPHTGLGLGRDVGETDVEKWHSMSQLLQELGATGMDLVSWEKIMDLHGARKRTLEDMQLESERVRDQVLPEVGPENGGDYGYSSHSSHRRWFRARAAMRIFEHVLHADLSGTIISKNNHCLQYTTVDAEFASVDTAAVDIGELHAFIAEVSAVGGACFLDASDVLRQLETLVSENHTHFKALSRSMLTQSFQEVAKIVNTTNSVTHAICKTLTSNRLMTNVLHVYDSVAAGEISWAEFLWLTEHAVEDAVRKHRQNAAAAVDGTSADPPRPAGALFPTDNYPVDLERQHQDEKDAAVATKTERIVDETMLSTAVSESALTTRPDPVVLSVSAEDSVEHVDDRTTTFNTERIEDKAATDLLDDVHAEVSDDPATTIMPPHETDSLHEESVSRTQLGHTDRTHGSAGPEHTAGHEAQHDVDDHSQHALEGLHDVSSSKRVAEDTPPSLCMHKIDSPTEDSRDQADFERTQRVVMEVTMRRKRRPTSAPLQSLRRSIHSTLAETDMKEVSLKPKSRTGRVRAKKMTKVRLAAFSADSTAKNALLEKRRDELQRQLSMANRRAERKSAAVTMQVDEMQRALVNLLKQEQRTGTK